ncbi:uncharacterized protein N0V89_005612 [Didymosphaeria variabile]|uniref:Concanavalin A-like lectin/glucanase n=1 Tax=Didymosphaeria variabile TaxID=1932322 RepID=A0A9W8XNU6_9PLEO|nr:uncharacterized protein N0V89_005612 [Didymosphaeria variabile]KAJ4353882.1 hypothetical protein N0V89_005612 [Didymosphaeria variabile]
MPSHRSLLALVAASLTSTASAAMGPAFSTGPVGSGAYIIEATSTLTLPAVPADQANDLSLWVGMGTSSGDLIQSIADNWNSKNWSIYAYTLVKTGDNSQMPVQTDGTDATEGDQITMHYKFDKSSGNYTQLVSINGNQVAELSTSSGQAQGWGSAVECAEDTCGTVAAHTWTDTKIVLSSADPNYDQTLGKGQGVTGELSTSDGGITWVATDINVPAFTFGSS